MTISIIGTGNVAYVLGQQLLDHGHTIHQLIGRNHQNVTDAARHLGAVPGLLGESIIEQSELIIIAVSDQAVASVVQSVGRIASPVVHTAGSLPMSILEPMARDYGVLYPLQSLHKNNISNQPIPFLIDANQSFLTDRLEQLVCQLGGHCRHAADEDRLRYHLAAVCVNNFTNHIFDQVHRYCQSNDLDFSILQPLIEETAFRLRSGTPANFQTGPAVRGDQGTIQKHIALLKDNPSLANIYIQLTASIQSAPKSASL